VDPETDPLYCGSAGLCTGTNPAKADYAGIACGADAGCVNGACPRLVPSGGRLAIHPSGKLVFAYNDGTSNINALSLAADNTLTPIGGQSTFPAGGDVETLVIDPSGRFLYAPGYTNTSLYAFSIGVSGALTALPGSPYPIGQSCQYARVDSTGSHLYVSCRNTFTLYVFAVDATTGALTNVTGSPFAVGVIQNRGVGNQDLVVDPLNRFLFLVNDASGNGGGVYGFPLPVTAGFPSAQLPGSPFDSGGRTPEAATLDSTGHFLYVANDGDGTVAGFAVDQTTGALTDLAGPPASLGVTQNPIVLTEDLAGSVLAAGTLSSVVVFPVGANGSLATPSSTPATGDVYGLGFDASTHFLYVAAEFEVDTYGVDATTGALTAVSGGSLRLR